MLATASGQRATTTSREINRFPQTRPPHQAKHNRAAGPEVAAGNDAEGRQRAHAVERAEIGNHGVEPLAVIESLEEPWQVFEAA